LRHPALPTSTSPPTPANAGQCLWDGSKLDLPLAVENLLILEGRFEI
jgi:hypothetical protein